MNMYELEGVSGELLDYQVNFLKLEEDNIIFNGCRNSAKTFLLAKIVEYKNAKNIVFVNEYNCYFEEFIVKIQNHTNYKLVQYNKDVGMAIFESYEGLIKIYNYDECKKLDNDIIYDYIFFEECLPFNIGVKSHKTISTISFNNSEEWLQRFYPSFKIYQVDYTIMIKHELLNKQVGEDAKRVNVNKYYNEYAILDNKE